MPIEIVFALIAITSGCAIFLGFAAGRRFRREDRLKAQARAWDQGYNVGYYDHDGMDYGPIPNPYATELEKIRNA